MNESTEDSLDTLEIYIYTIGELIEKFNKKKNPTKFHKDEFFSQYVQLEDKILSFLDTHIENKSSEMKKLVDIFLEYWEKYQECWPQEYWNFYNKFSVFEKHIDKNNFNSHQNNIENFHNIFITSLLKTEIDELNKIEEKELIKDEKVNIMNDENDNNNLEIENERMFEHANTSMNISKWSKVQKKKNLDKYENMIFSNGNFLKNPLKNISHGKNIEMDVNKDISNKFEKNPIETEFKEKDKIDQIIELRLYESSTDSEDGLRGKKKNKMKSSKGKSDLIKDIDKEIDLDFNSENYAHTGFFHNEFKKDKEKKSKMNKKCRLCLDCLIF